ncbi:M48 family metallopeptidase [Actinoplanes sp. Pm04-4]|uniref:M48 family metallopeptidase n=1 Tax=Paractinoplanes pyxinae TaxID=2997416 RepID=A0ABT4BCR9_9ACTN|nr:M48 family metallopeptidase [Actinoplanes pyxinae]MCY1144271.1 M48 family metallopeptidase [Actinoplanes pyxinae]
MTSTTLEPSCPECGTQLATAPDEAPWCSACEWNLDHFPGEPRYSWFWNRMAAADRRAGYRSDRLLAESTDPEPVGRNDYRVLVGISAVVMAAMVAAIAGGLWLIVAGGPFWPIVIGLLLLGFAAVLRPRFQRFKPLLTTSYQVEPAQAPTLYEVMERIADRLETPRPDAVLITFGWNAGVLTTGPRPRRVLILGVQLLLALRPAEVVALLGHELGHLKYADTRRGLLTAPARDSFGRLSELIRPPAVSPWELGPSIQLAGLLIWQLTGGVVSWLLFAVHVAINRLSARDQRTVELRADDLAARAAGTEAALRLVDVLAAVPVLTGFVQHHVPKGEAALRWRRMLHAVRERESAGAPARRQLSIRTEASLFATHPAPGRRHQWLSARPPQVSAVHLTESEASALEQEFKPYAEALHRTMLKEIVHD